MNIRLKIFLIVICLLFIAFLIRKVGKKKIELRFCLPWMLISMFLMLITIFDKALIPIKNFFGFEELSNMIFLVGFGCLILIVLSLTTKLSLLNSRVIDLTQELAILKKEKSNEKSNK